MPKAQRLGRLEKRRSRSARAEATADGALLALPAPTSETEDGAQVPSAQAQRFSHSELAAMLWSTDYVPLFLGELEQYSDVSVRASLCSLLAHSRLRFSHSRMLCAVSGASHGNGRAYAIATARRARRRSSSSPAPGFSLLGACTTALAKNHPILGGGAECLLAHAEGSNSCLGSESFASTPSSPSQCLTCYVCVLRTSGSGSKFYTVRSAQSCSITCWLADRRRCSQSAHL